MKQDHVTLPLASKEMQSSYSWDLEKTIKIPIRLKDGKRAKLTGDIFILQELLIF